MIPGQRLVARPEQAIDHPGLRARQGVRRPPVYKALGRPGAVGLPAIEVALHVLAPDDRRPVWERVAPVNHLIAVLDAQQTAEPAKSGNAILAEVFVLDGGRPGCEPARAVLQIQGVTVGQAEQIQRAPASP